MAVYTVAAGQLAVHNKTLAANIVDAINFDVDPSAVEIQTDGAAAIYVTTDGSTPTVGGANTHLIPAIAGSRFIRHGGDRGLRLISAGTPTYSVTKISAQDIGDSALSARIDALADSLESGGGGSVDLSAVDQDVTVINGHSLDLLNGTNPLFHVSLKNVFDRLTITGSEDDELTRVRICDPLLPADNYCQIEAGDGQTSLSLVQAATGDGGGGAIFAFAGSPNMLQVGCDLQVSGSLDLRGATVLLQAGVGITFVSPDGLTTKTLSIDNSGDPVWT